MASIERLPSGKWRVIYYHQGKRFSSHALNSADDARQWAAMMEGDRAKGTFKDPLLLRTPLREYAETWYQLRPHGPNHGQSRGKERWALDRHILPALGDKPLGKITRHDVQAFVNHLHLGPASVRSVYTILGAILRMADADGHMPHGAPLGRGLVTLPKMDSEPTWTLLDFDQLQHLLDVCQERHPATYPIVRVLADTGMRQGELFGLRRRDYSRTGPWLDVRAALKRVNGVYVKGTRTKTGMPRRIVLADTTVEALDAQLAAHSYDLVFPNRKGGPRDISAWRSRVWKPLVEDAGFPSLNPHDLRHIHVTHLLDLRVDPAVVAQRVGHASVKITLDVYGHVLPGRQEEALQLLNQRRRS